MLKLENEGTVTTPIYKAETETAVYHIMNMGWVYRIHDKRTGITFINDATSRDAAEKACNLFERAK